MNLALSLFILYAGGKVFTLLAHGIAIQGFMLFALFWQDALVAVLVGAGWKLSRRAGWLLYGLAVLHFAASMPLLRLMATPLTAPLMRAGGGTLADSISHHLDFVNVALIILTLLLGIVLPLALARTNLRLRPLGVTILGGAVVTGWIVTSKSDLQGLHRNSVVAFASSFWTDEPVSKAFGRSVPPREPIKSLRLPTGWNLLLVALESTGARHLATYGASRDPMPFLSELARSAVVFENAYAGYPESIKGLLSVLASRQPEFGLKTEDFAVRARPSLATICGAAGYATALFHSGRFMYLGMDEVVTSAGFQAVEDAGTIGGNHNSSFGVDDFSTVDRVLQWLKVRDKGKPFFVHYLPIAGHHPYDSPVEGPFRGSDDESNYRNALHYSDLALQRLFEGLKTSGSLANTLVVLYGDHGEAFGEHPGNFGHTLYLYEENVRVPLIFWNGGNLEAQRIATVASLTDIAPTICDLLGLRIPTAFEGASHAESFGPAAEGGSRRNLSVRPAIFLTDYSMSLYGLRIGPWKFIHEQESGFSRLYDLAADPHERTNLTQAFPGLVRDFRRGVFEWSDGGKDSKLAADSNPAASR